MRIWAGRASQYMGACGQNEWAEERESEREEEEVVRGTGRRKWPEGQEGGSGQWDRKEEQSAGGGWKETG